MDIDTLLELRLNVQKFIRLFGLLEQTVTPCGYPLSLSEVYALQEIETTTMSISEVALKLHLERSSVSRLIDGLVKEGFILRRPNTENRREMLLSLTDKGHQSIKQVRSTSIQFYEGILNHLSDRDQKLITDGFEKFTNALLSARGKSHD